jgi:hypothetical protein
VRPDVLQHFSSHPDAEAALDQVLQYGQRLLLLRANDWSALAAEGGTGEGGGRGLVPVGWMGSACQPLQLFCFILQDVFLYFCASSAFLTAVLVVDE